MGRIVKLCAGGLTAIVLMGSVPASAQVYGYGESIAIRPYYDDSYGWPGYAGSVVPDVRVDLQSEVSVESSEVQRLDVAPARRVRRVVHRSVHKRFCAPARPVSGLALGTAAPSGP